MKFLKFIIIFYLLLSSCKIFSQVIDAVSGASLYYNNRSLSKKEIIDLILYKHNDRVLVVSTTNVDGSPNTGVFTLTAIDTILMIYGGDNQQTIKNIKRTKNALVTLYKIPYKGEIYSKHIGARIYVRLIDNKEKILQLEKKKGVKDEAGMWYFLEMISIKPLG